MWSRRFTNRAMPFATAQFHQFIIIKKNLKHGKLRKGKITWDPYALSTRHFIKLSEHSQRLVGARGRPTLRVCDVLTVAPMGTVGSSYTRIFYMRFFYAV